MSALEIRLFLHKRGYLPKSLERLTRDYGVAVRLDLYSDALVI